MFMAGLSQEDDPMHISRRATVAGLAALPAIASTTVTADTLAPDPVFAAIARYRRAVAALEAADERAEPARFGVVSDEHIAACESLFDTRPTTLAGCRALIDHFMLDVAADEMDSDSHRTLRLLAEALERIDGPLA